MSRAQRSAFGIHYQNCFASRGLAAIYDIAGEDPRMARSNTIGCFSINTDSLQRLFRLSHRLQPRNTIFGRWVS